jgi:hypothetical protein
MRHILFLLLLLVAGILSAQIEGQPQNRSQFEHVREQLLLEIRTRESLEQRTAKLQSQMETIPVTGNDTAKLRGYLLVQRELSSIQQELQNASRRQLALLNTIGNLDAQNETYPQFKDYLTEARAQLQSIGTTQKNMMGVLRKITTILPLRVRALPPPREFVSQTGLKMRLFGTGRQAFYLSAEPIPECAGQTLLHCRKAAETLSEQENAPYQLPSVEELRLAAQDGLATSCAAWTRSEWNEHGSVQEALRNRFDIHFFCIWDDSNLLGHNAKGSDSYGELPEARHHGLGAYFSTPVKTGLQLRWAKVQASLAVAEEVNDK